MNGEKPDFYCELNDYYDSIEDRIVDTGFLSEIGGCTLMLALSSMVDKQQAARLQSNVLEVQQNDAGLYLVTYELFSGREDVTEITSKFYEGFLLAGERSPTPDAEMGYFLGEDPDEYDWDWGEWNRKQVGQKLRMPVQV